MDQRHALYIGWVAGMALNHGLDVSYVDDAAGNHTDRLTIGLVDRAVTVVVPAPPEDWQP